ncbi:MAG TPA: methyltransferase domain-containing protein [Candidatus Acidoferrales bacterium]|nr:methyltransferase domain-containing protein [Candidatus Acidoferrales bacterium]
MARILDIGCGRKKYPGSIGVDMSPAGQADVLCDWTKTLPFADSSFDQVRMIHIIEEVDDIFRVLGEAHRVAKPGARVVIVTPHYTDHASYCSPAHRWHLSSFSLWFFSDRPMEYDYYAPAQYRERKVHVELLRVWRGLGFQFFVNRFRAFRKFWEQYLSFVIRGKTVEWELEVVKQNGAGAK